MLGAVVTSSLDFEATPRLGCGAWAVTPRVMPLVLPISARAPDRPVATRVVHDGSEGQVRGATQLVPSRELDQLTWTDAPTPPS